MSAFIYVLLTLSMLLCSVRSDVNDPTVRKTENGFVKGIALSSSLGETYYAFRSVRYAEPPITGVDPNTKLNVDRRFKAPEPLKFTWTGELDVKDFKYSCVESTTLIPTVQPTGEDCLYLNIYVPARGKEKKTVLVWIHGGGFTEGGHREALYGPDFLLAEDNVVVAVQYRLGIFGFLNLGSDVYTGNMGLKDQRLALKWVYENIENFSGNKNAILLFGESAGGASTTFHMLNEESRKYFTRALVMSGTVYSYFAFTPANHFLKISECAHTNVTSQIMEYLKGAPSSDIFQCYQRPDWGLTLKPEWVPTIEPKRIEDAMLTEIADVIWASKNAPVLDTMFTMVNQEQVTFDPSLPTRKEPLITPDLVSSIVLPFDGLYPQEYKAAIKLLRDAYYSGKTDLETVSRENIALMSDLNFNDSVLKALKLQAKANCKSKNTFFLRFGMNGQLNWIQHLHKQNHKGAAHAEELCYIFHCHMLDKDNVYDDVISNENHPGYLMIRRLVKIITNFATTGDPSVKGLVPFEPLQCQEKMFVFEVTNATDTLVKNDDIEQELRYKTWRQIDEMYDNLVNAEE